MTYRIQHGIVDHLRTWGLTVHEVPGWQGRGHHDFPAAPLVIVDHHTGTPDTVKGDFPTQNVCVDGRSDLKGPLCNFGLGRSGDVYVVADGVAWHAGAGTWDGVDVGNDHSAGIEAESAGGGHWTPAQLHAYPLLNAALCSYWEIPAKRVCAHRESATPHGRKDDPVGIDMTQMRQKVADLLKAGPAGHQAPPAAAAAKPSHPFGSRDLARSNPPMSGADIAHVKQRLQVKTPGDLYDLDVARAVGNWQRAKGWTVTEKLNIDQQKLLG